MKLDARIAILLSGLALFFQLLLVDVSHAATDSPEAAATPRNLSARDYISTKARLAERLVPSKSTEVRDDDALAEALRQFEVRARVDDFSGLAEFLREHPESGWAPSVATNLGLLYLHHGYFTEALAAFELAQRAGASATEPSVKVIVDRAIGERTRLLASLGKFGELTALFREVGPRPISGSATELYQTAREDLTLYEKGANHQLNCGPSALRSLLLSLGRNPNDVVRLEFFPTGKRGTNLAQLANLAKQYKLSSQLILWSKGQPIPKAAIVHWKVGHFAAIVGETNGRIHVVDPVFPSREFWITPAALEAEASGYMLVPISGADRTWRIASKSEASGVWGAGPTSSTRPGGAGDPRAHRPTPTKPKCPLCEYDIAESAVALTLSDTPVGYDPPIGPSTKLTISYNQREASQPATFGFFNVGPKWTLSWLDYVIDDPTNIGGSVSRYLSEGGAYYYSGYDASTGRFSAQDIDGSVLILTGTSPISYRRQLGDGSVEIYSQSDGSTAYPRKVFLTQRVDPQGNALQLNYDGQLRLTSVTDAAGRQSTLSYNVPFRPMLVSKITDPFGRSANLTYDANGRLSSITDIIGLTSSFTYDANSLVNSLTTPYGTSSFSYTTPGTDAPPRFVDVTDPLGFHEREEWLEPSSAIPNSDPSATVPVGMPYTLTNNYLQYRNSFHWDKVQYAAAGCTPTGGCDYAKARISHFLHFGNANIKDTALESVKEPLENRVWYSYLDQASSIRSGTFASPIATGRVLDDGTTQITSTAYDQANFFKPTSVTDGVGRTTKFAYANGIDLAAIAQRTANGNLTTIAQITYDTRHLPTMMVDAAGQVTKFSYNPSGQLLTFTDPLGHVTQYQYDGTGDLTTVINANGQTQRTLTYDAFARIATSTDSEGLTIAYSYDAADRITKLTYPDGTSENYTYNRLDLANFTDRIGRTWRYAYDANRNLLSETDPLGKQTLFTYSGTDKRLSMTDANGNVTGWTYDIQSRPTQKLYADTSTVLYTYETTTSRLKTIQDALNQQKVFAYNHDNSLASVSYVAPVNPTPNVAFTYDPYFARLATMTDGSGTTQYVYQPVGTNGALQLAQVTTPVSGATIAYGYDELGRVTARTVAGSGAETFQYDVLGRLTTHGSDLGSFGLTYLGQTGQIAQRALASSTLKTVWSYLPNSGDRRLEKIENTGLSGSRYSNFTFTSNAADQITGVTQDADASVSVPAASTQSATYNTLNQLTNLSGQALTYDAVGNVLSDGQRTYTWDAENRLLSIAYPGQPGKLTTFSYDGLGRRYQLSSTPAGGGTPTVSAYVWCGEIICQARDGSGNPARAYFDEGEYVSGSTPQQLYYGTDQLGSVRRVFASTGSTPAYDYDPYGNPLQGTAPVTDFGYAGMFTHADSGLSLAVHRAYNPDTGRWLSRDPLGEGANQSYNLYGYVNGNPVAFDDPMGLCPPRWKRCLFGVQRFFCFESEEPPQPLPEPPSIERPAPERPPAPYLKHDPQEAPEFKLPQQPRPQAPRPTAPESLPAAAEAGSAAADLGFALRLGAIAGALYLALKPNPAY